MQKSRSYQPIGWRELREDVQNQSSWDIGNLPDWLYLLVGILAAVFVVFMVARGKF